MLTWAKLGLMPVLFNLGENNRYWDMKSCTSFTAEFKFRFSQSLLQRNTWSILKRTFPIFLLSRHIKLWLLLWTIPLLFPVYSCWEFSVSNSQIAFALHRVQSKNCWRKHILTDGNLLGNKFSLRNTDRGGGRECKVKPFYYPGIVNRTQSNWISIELNRTQSMDWVRLGSICSIEFDWFGNRTHTKLGVRFRSNTELNRTQSTDCVRLSSISEGSTDYAGSEGLRFVV